jgi:prophage tail gpP-like protein
VSPVNLSSSTKDARQSVESLVASGGVKKLVESTGRLPPVSLIATPLDNSGRLTLERFLTYKYSSSILIPVDTFEFTFVAPDDDQPFNKRVKDGDIVSLLGAGDALSTGIVDLVDLEVDDQFGEKVQINGRDLMGQFEDQDAISIDDKPIWANKLTIDGVARRLMENTRIRNVRVQDAPAKAYLFATEPGESKLAALQRFLEPLNCLAWMDPDGTLVVGRPNMAQPALGRLYLSKTRRDSNVISMKATRNATSIPNIVLPIWSGQETVQDRVKAEQRLYNAAPGPTRLRKQGHRVPKCVVVSAPNGADAQELAGVNRIVVAGGSNILQAYAKREIARQNIKELLVQAVVPGHYNENGQPYRPDQVYKIEFDRGDVDENMYLYQVEYQLDESKGQRTVLFFCRLGTIVSDVRAP